MTKKEKRPLKVGERCRVYAGSLQLIGAKGTVNNICGHNDLYHVKLDVPTPVADTPLVHRHQLRLIKKRPKAAEERVEISGETNGRDFYIRTASYGARRMLELAMPIQNGPGRNFFVTEIREGEIPLSREALEKAWKACGMSDPASAASKFWLFTGKLGFPEKEPK